MEGILEVRVATRGGGASYLETIDLVGGVALRGGYSADFSSQDPGLYPTVIESGAVSVISASSGSDGAILDGFVIRGAFPENPMTVAYGMQISHVNRITVRNCSIEPRASGELSVGIAISYADQTGDGSQVLIENSAIEAGTAAEWGGASSYGVWIEYSSVALRGNRIESGQVENTGSTFGEFGTIGVKLNNSTVILDRNTIVTGDVISAALVAGSIQSWAVFATAESEPRTLVVTNNLMKAGDSAYEIGLIISLDFHHTVANNTIVVDSTNQGPGEGVVALRLNTNLDGAIHNNLFVDLGAGGGTNGNIIAMNSGAMGANLSFESNAMVNFKCAGRGSSNTCLSLSEQESLLVTLGARVAPNAWYATLAEAFFSDVAGSDFSLTSSSPASLRLDGKDASQDTCGESGTASCGQVTVDLMGLPRTCPSEGICYSIGAWELD